MRKVVLQDRKTPGQRREVTAALNDDGELVIDGWELSKGVGLMRGDDSIEHEWTWVIRGDGLQRLRLALGGGDVLESLQTRFRDEASHGLAAYLAEHAVDYEVLWSRIGG